MLRNCVRAVIRVLRRRRGYAFITVGGLALAMAVCVLTITWAHYEFSFDRFHGKGRDIYKNFLQEQLISADHRYFLFEIDWSGRCETSGMLAILD